MSVHGSSNGQNWVLETPMGLPWDVSEIECHLESVPKQLVAPREMGAPRTDLPQPVLVSVLHR